MYLSTVVNTNTLARVQVTIFTFTLLLGFENGQVARLATEMGQQDDDLVD